MEGAQRMKRAVDAIATHARSQPQRLACVDLESGRRWTYRDLDGQVSQTAAWMVQQVGGASGARIATLARNCADLLIVHLACIRAGAVYTPLNWRLAPPEIAQLVADAQPAMLIYEPAFSLSAFDGQTIRISDLERSIAGAPSAPPVQARRAAHDPATLLYTSGTSGTPKGVIVTEDNAFWSCTNFIHGNEVTSRSVFLCDMPMFHTAGLFAAVRTPLLAGAAVLISQGFDAPKTLARIADPKLAVTHYFSVPQMAQRLWEQPGFDPIMLRGLTVYAMGGAPNPAAQIERFVRAGIKMSDGFGMSETGSNFGMPFEELDLLLRKAGSCGLPYLSVEARIVDSTGKDLPEGERGELWLRGPSVTPGYWNKPALTAQAFQEGWFKTGDAAVRDVDGFYFLVDRIKDMFISGGENVYPAEIEAVIAELEEVAEVAVVGIRDEQWGEVGRAYVRVAPGRQISADRILSYCRSRLARYKAPASVVFTSEIPRTASGKVQKHLLKS
jgi:fatty-acyl-CoA synthase